MPIFWKLFLIAFSVIFISVGVAIGFFAAQSAREQADRAERLVPESAVGLSRRGVGDEVLIEGRVSQLNPVVLNEFVAYRAQEFRGTYDDDGDPEWSSLPSVTPPLLIEVPRGRVTIMAEYELEGNHTEYREPGSLYWDSWNRRGTRRYQGLLANQPITAIGTVVRSNEGNALRAEFVFAGDRANYIKTQRETAAFLPWFGLIFIVFGAIAGGTGVMAFVRNRTDHESSASTTPS